jgi:hypothetical protein
LNSGGFLDCLGEIEGQRGALQTAYGGEVRKPGPSISLQIEIKTQRQVQKPKQKQQKTNKRNGPKGGGEDLLFVGIVCGPFRIHGAMEDTTHHHDFICTRGVIEDSHHLN